MSLGGELKLFEFELPGFFCIFALVSIFDIKVDNSWNELMYYLDRISSRNKHKIWNIFIETNAYACNRALNIYFKTILIQLLTLFLIAAWKTWWHINHLLHQWNYRFLFTYIVLVSVKKICVNYRENRVNCLTYSKNPWVRTYIFQG